MKPLISIETIPISIEYTTTRPQQKSNTRVQSAELNVSKENDRVTITSNPIRIQLQDRFEQNVPRYYTATTEYAENGTLRMNVQFQDDPASAEGEALRYRAAGSGIDRMIDAAPRTTARPQAQKQAQPVSSMPFIGLKIDFDMAKLSETQGSAQRAETDFIPPDLEVEIVEYPKVIIKYVGGPIYFPRSADPNYEPPATEAHFKAMA
ncbi:MAG: hypothetical protein LBB57_05765 [Clostridiales Family XIII bacterium]|jgi:hypothetical protein|nr:hypothetical protein [Clostridiales Family XIII bacterium]